MWYSGQNAQDWGEWRAFLKHGHIFRYNSKNVQYFVLQSKEAKKKRRGEIFTQERWDVFEI